ILIVMIAIAMIADTIAYKINQDGLKFIEEQEGFNPNFYPDSAGEVILKRDLAEKETCVTELTKIKINPDQFSALVLFAYNFGCPYYKSTSLLQKLNSGDIKGTANEFRLYNKSKGKINKGLIKRREAEKALFCKNG
ncbi:39173_t:CDS:2, partial [Gigaspora margarita]